MLSTFYKKYGRHLLLLTLALFPVLNFYADGIRTNNDIEAVASVIRCRQAC